MLYLNNVEQILFTARLPQTFNIPKWQLGNIVPFSHTWITQCIFIRAPKRLQDLPIVRTRTRNQMIWPSKLFSFVWGNTEHKNLKTELS